MSPVKLCSLSPAGKSLLLEKHLSASSQNVNDVGEDIMYKWKNHEFLYVYIESRNSVS